MRKNKTVFVFGAGASQSEGLPSQAELLKTYFKYNATDSFKNDLEKYFKDFFEINFQSLDSINFPTFEEALGIIELAIDKEESFGPNYSLAKLREIKTALILSMGIAIERCALNDARSYEKLISKLFHRGHFIKDEYGFINFNYDILLDKALMKLLQRDIYVDYGIKFANEEVESEDFPKWESPKDKSTIYLKPHGSFNWMCCSTCNSMYMLGNKKSGIFRTGYLHRLEHCIKDESPLDCVIEPPSFFKKYKNIYLQVIWKRMYDLLLDSNLIVFIGYSLPEADIWTKYLLKKSCFGGHKRIIAVNPLAREKEKYERLLGHVTYHPIDFSDFVVDIKKYIL